MNGTEKQTINRDKSDKRIVEYFENRSKLNEIVKSKDRSRFTRDEENFDMKLRQDKKRLLDSVIFSSMANLRVFFEYLKENEELREVFEKDIKELFDLEHNILGNFLESILTWDIEKDPDNFRLGLIVEMQQVIYHKLVDSMSGSIYDKKSLTILSQTIDNDMRKALSWTQFWYSSKFVEKERKIKS